VTVAMKRNLSLWSALVCLSCTSVGRCAAFQTPAASTAQQSAQPAVHEQATPTDFTSKKGFVLEDETPVRLRLNRTISSDDAHVGDTVDFETLDDITVNGTLAIPKGGLAVATVTEAQAKRRVAQLDINIDYVKLVSGERASLRAVKDVKGGGMVGGTVATSLVFLPAAPFFLFMDGKDISIPKGTEITAYVNGDVRLDIAKFQPAAPPNAPAQGAAASSSNENVGFLSAKLRLESDPAGADIEIDGSFVGNTPSGVDVATGEHSIAIKKAGYETWERELKVTGGDVNLSAELEKKNVVRQQVADSSRSVRAKQRGPEEVAPPVAALGTDQADAHTPSATTPAPQTNVEVAAASVPIRAESANLSTPPAGSTGATRGVFPSVLDGSGRPSNWKNSLAPSSSGTWWQVSSPAEPAPKVGLSRAAIFFPLQKVGTESVAISVVITNNTPAALTISDMRIAGNDSSDFIQANNCGRTIGAGANCDVWLVFRPTANGTRKAVLTVDGAEQEITITGIGK